MGNIAIYVRVSTEGQDLQNQLLELRKWAAREEHQVVEEYCDVASGAGQRERLHDLYADAHRGAFDIVAIWSIDRLTREGVPATIQYVHGLDAVGVKLYSHQQAYLNPSLPFYHTIMAMYADLAKVEKDLISQRTKAALQKLVEKGVKLGRPKGSIDKKPRKKAGYYRRWERARTKRSKV